MRVENPAEQALKKAVKVFIHLTCANMPGSITLPVQKSTIRALINQGWDGYDADVATFRLDEHNNLYVFFST